MIFNAIKTLAEMNMSEGPHILFVYVAEIVPFFMELFFSAILMVLTLGIFIAQERLKGDANFFVAFAVGAWITFGGVVILSFIPNLINLLTIVIFLSISILAAVTLFITSALRTN